MTKRSNPVCHDCGKGGAHVTPHPSGTGVFWLCGSCELLRENPEAKKGRVVRGLPIEGRPAKLQKETLFNPEENT